MLDVSSKDLAKSMRLAFVNLTPKDSSIKTESEYVYSKSIQKFRVYINRANSEALRNHIPYDQVEELAGCIASEHQFYSSILEVTFLVPANLLLQSFSIVSKILQCHGQDS
jgi:hypothetical protein